MRHVRATDNIYLTRGDFLKIAGALGLSTAGMTLLEACGFSSAALTPETTTLETTTIRLGHGPSICLAPLHLAEDLLKAEGFTDVQYVAKPSNIVVDAMTAGEIDIAMQFAGPIINYVDIGKPLIVLAGIHVGCFVLFGTEGVNVISDLKDKTVAIAALSLGSPEYAFLSSILAYVGLTPNTDVNWLNLPASEARQSFTDGKSDAFLAFPPVVQELEAKKIGHVVVDSMMDKPWSQYYCCMMTGRKDFVQRNPVATKRALRAIMKATDICALNPERAAKLMVDKGFAENYEHALQAMQQIPYNVWRDYDPEDTLRFYALRLHDAGLVKSSPEEIIKQGTDWHFLNELKVEMKG